MAFKNMEYFRTGLDSVTFINNNLFSRIDVSVYGGDFTRINFPHFNKNAERLYVKPEDIFIHPNYDRYDQWDSVLTDYWQRNNNGDNYIWSYDYFPTLYRGYHSFSISCLHPEYIDMNKTIDVYQVRMDNSGRNYPPHLFARLSNDEVWSGYIDFHTTGDGDLGRFVFLIFVPLKSDIEVPETGLSVIFKDVYGESEIDYKSNLLWSVNVAVDGKTEVKQFLLRTISSYIDTIVLNFTSFTAAFYSNSSAAKRVNKIPYLSNYSEFDILIKSPTSVQTPVINLKLDYLPVYNYCYIAKFNRFYFVNNITSLNNNLYEFTLSVDVLMSFKEEILKQKCFIATNEFINNRNFYNKKAIYDNKVVRGFQFLSSPFGDYDPNQEAYYAMQFVGYTSGGSRFSSAQTLTYVMDRTALENIFTKLINPDFWDAIGSLWGGDPTEGIISIRAYPFDFTSLPASQFYDLVRVTTISVPWGKDLSEIGGNCFKLTNVRTISLPFRGRLVIDDVLQLPPYSRYSIFLPYVGIVDLPDFVFPNSLQSFNIEGNYLINLDTGTATVTIQGLNASAPYAYIGDCEISRNIPINKTNAVEKAGKYVTTAVKLATSVAQVGMSISQGGAAVANAVITPTKTNLSKAADAPFQVVDKAFNLLNDIASVNHNVPMVHGNSNDVLLGLSGVYTPLLMYERPNLISTQSQYFGTPVYDNYTLSELSGYTTIGAVHLDGFDLATTDEVNMVSNILVSGVIL